MARWIERIKFVESEKNLGKGEGGKTEDDEYFIFLPNIWRDRSEVRPVT